jgi:hypothetical protein
VAVEPHRDGPFIAADHAHNVEGFDAVADSEFVDERIRL